MDALDVVHKEAYLVVDVHKGADFDLDYDDFDWK